MPLIMASGAAHPGHHRGIACLSSAVPVVLKVGQGRGTGRLGGHACTRIGEIVLTGPGRAGGPHLVRVRVGC